MPRVSIQVSFTTASMSGCCSTKAPTCTDGASSAAPSRSESSTSGTRSCSRFFSASSPPATRSQASWKSAPEAVAGVKERYVAGSTAATRIARFSITDSEMEMTATSVTPSTADTAETVSSEAVSGRTTRKSAGATTPG